MVCTHLDTHWYMVCTSFSRSGLWCVRYPNQCPQHHMALILEVPVFTIIRVDHCKITHLMSGYSSMLQAGSCSAMSWAYPDNSSNSWITVSAAHLTCSVNTLVSLCSIAVTLLHYPTLAQGSFIIWTQTEQYSLNQNLKRINSQTYKYWIQMRIGLLASSKRANIHLCMFLISTFVLFSTSPVVVVLM